MMYNKHIDYVNGLFKNTKLKTGEAIYRLNIRHKYIDNKVFQGVTVGMK